MRVVVLNSCVPFVRGGAEHLADALVEHLEIAGHEATLVRLPFAWNPVDRVADSMLAASLTSLDRADRVIGLKFPAYLVPHSEKVLWLLHQFRQVYDLWRTERHELPDTETVGEVREMVHRADNQCFSECRAIYANSPITAERLLGYNGYSAQVLWPPPATTPEPTAGDRGYDGPIVCLGRVNGAKRQQFAVEALANTRTDVKLVVAGAPESAADEARLRAVVAEHGLEGRVELVLRYISEDEKQELLRDALAVAYLPTDEDSYGYVTVEAFGAEKPVVTCTDSGGIRLLVDERTGAVTEPDPVALAEAFDRLHADRALARRLGMEGRARVEALDLSWERVVEVLTS
jgi:glycosyltransferase involved in cell wall biosynthesis